MNTTVCDNGAIQFTFFLVVRLNIITIKSYTSFIAILVPLFIF